MIDIVVVNMKHSSYDIRIDRRTIWGNRHRVEDWGRTRAIERFEAEVQDKPWLVRKLLDRVLELDKPIVRLGCHCKPEPCHGDVLKRLLLERLT